MEVANKHVLDVRINVTFVTTNGKLSEAQARMLSTELMEHIEQAFSKRDFLVLEIGECEVNLS